MRCRAFRTGVRLRGQSMSVLSCDLFGLTVGGPSDTRAPPDRASRAAPSHVVLGTGRLSS